MAEFDKITRAEAKATGAKYYFPGTPCKNGHVAKRYTTSTICTECRELGKRTDKGARDAAKAAGLIHYFTGRPCIRGHIAARSTSNGTCIMCAKEDRQSEAGRARQQAYFVANKPRMLAKSLEYHYAHRESRLAKNAERYLKNYERYRAAGRIAQKRWDKANPDKVLAKVRKRQARERGAEGSFTVEDIQWLMKRQRGCCAECGCSIKQRKNRRVDHIMPLAKGGSNYRRNLQLLCTTCNQAKAAKHPIDWARSRGRLL
jgi:5-methylcytosine-specific restriction endonuclease McrA